MQTASEKGDEHCVKSVIMWIRRAHGGESYLLIKLIETIIQLLNNEQYNNKYISINTLLTINRLNSHWKKSLYVLKKIRLIYMLPMRGIILDVRSHTDWKVKGGKKILYESEPQKKAGIALLMSDKIAFKTDCNKR